MEDDGILKKKERYILPLTVLLDIFESLFTLMTQFKKNNTIIVIENPLGYEKFIKGLQAWMISLVDPYFLEHGWNDFGSSEESMMVQKVMLDVGCNVL